MLGGCLGDRALVDTRRKIEGLKGVSEYLFGVCCVSHSNKLVKADGRTLPRTKYVEIRTEEQKPDNLPAKESKTSLHFI